MADGLATRQAFSLPTRILREWVDDFTLVSENEIRVAIRKYLELCHTVAEGAGAAPLAGAMKMKEMIEGKKVALVLSGGNLDYETLREIIGGSSR
jgi:threonine dehydratase